MINKRIQNQFPLKNVYVYMCLVVNLATPQTAQHSACIGTLGLMECQSACFMSLESADSHDSDLLREKIESCENSSKMRYL